MNPQPPKLYGLIKLHKDNLPIRPVVSYVKAPCKNLCTELIKPILEHTKFSATFALKNSQDLINKIKNLEIPHNSKLLSFDVKSLFTSIPPKEVLNLISCKLDENHINPVIKWELLQLLNLCIDQNYFQFGGDFYNQTTGLAMGNPLSPLLAEIFMNNLETEISKHYLFKNCIYWFRYVDDILICFNGTERQLSNLHNYINTVHPNIKFTIETETNKSINFLDLTISHHGKKHEFAIYHKPTHTDTTIHATSCHPLNHKLSAYNSMIHKLISVPMSKQNFDLELNRIYKIAINNGYSINLINSILIRKQKDHTMSLIYPKIIQKERKNYRSITYIGNISEKIARLVNTNTNRVIAYKTNNSIGKYIKNNKDKTNRSSNSGIYKLTCECGKSYIGQTGRTFEKRISEHKKHYEGNSNCSAYANHCITFNHKFNDKFDILHIQDKGTKLDLLEHLEINRYTKLNLILNDQINVNRSPLLSLNL